MFVYRILVTNLVFLPVDSFILCLNFILVLDPCFLNLFHLCPPVPLDPSFVLLLHLKVFIMVWFTVSTGMANSESHLLILVVLGLHFQSIFSN